MRINLILINLCIMTILTSCGQNRIPSTENEEAKKMTINKIPLNENVLNEEWHNNENEDLDLPVDTTISWLGQMHNGTDCYFHKDNTFKICIWRYSVSSGHHQFWIEGNYQYNSDTREISLSFDEKSELKLTHNSKGKPYPVAYFTMEGLKIKRPLHSSYDIKNEFLILSKSYLKVVEQSENKIRVDLYAFKENGERISFGHQTYLRKCLE